MDAAILKRANDLQGTVEELDRELKTLQQSRTGYMYPLQVKVCYIGEAGYQAVIDLMADLMVTRRDQAQAEFDAL